MQHAVEFITKKKQGRMIEIPAEYVDSVKGEFRVILILNTPPKQKKVVKKKTFEAFKVKTKGFKFNRDDAYKE